MALTTKDILSIPRPSNVSERLVKIFERAREEAINQGKTRSIEPTHLLSAMVFNGVQGIGSSLIGNHINSKYSVQFRQMLSEPVAIKCDHLSKEELSNPGFIKLWNTLMEVFSDDETYEGDVSYSKKIDQVLKMAEEEIAHKLGNKDLESGELLAAILAVCENDPRVKLFVKETGVTYKSVLECLEDRDRKSHYRKVKATEEAHSFNLEAR